jgi:hypothetical protein
LADELGGCVLLCLQTTELPILVQIFMQWVTVTAAYVNIICVFTTTSHHLAVVGAVLFHSFCMNTGMSQDVMRTCNILCVHVTEILL